LFRRRRKALFSFAFEYRNRRKIAKGLEAT
jgi:hypothetical protein